jgi:hypothetical protein
MREIMKRWIVKLQRGFTPTPKQFILTRMVEKFDVIQKMPLAVPIKINL